MAVPKLRFKEFDRDWTTESLGNVTDITKLAGYEFTKHINYQDSGEIIALRGLNVKGNNLVLEDVKYIDNSDLSMLSRSKLYIDDLLFTYVGTIGEVALIPENDKFYLAPNVCRIRRVNKNILSKYLMFLFSNENFKKNQIDKYTTKSSQPALSMENIRKFEIVFPSVEEQTKIASFLSAVDEKISQLSQKHQLLSQYKQGMMQKLFSQQIRFKADDGSAFGEWEDKKLGEIASKVGSGSTPRGGAEAYVDSGIIFIRSQNVNNDQLLLEDVVFIPENTHQKMAGSKVIANDILLNITGASIGRSCVVPKNFTEGNVNQHVCIIRTPNDEPKFIQAFLSSKNGQDLIESYQTGSGREGLNFQSIRSFDLSMPCLEEQTKIANFLSVIDQKIEVVAQQIEQAKTWKKGLLQQMFV